MNVNTSLRDNLVEKIATLKQVNATVFAEFELLSDMLEKEEDTIKAVIKAELDGKLEKSEKFKLSDKTIVSVVKRESVSYDTQSVFDQIGHNIVSIAKVDAKLFEKQFPAIAPLTEKETKTTLAISFI